MVFVSHDPGISKIFPSGSMVRYSGTGYTRLNVNLHYVNFR
ncbi:hypothetical protein [Rhizobium sp. NFR07]|nr:hypothetical protein [Rhizobium sp. NFR07]